MRELKPTEIRALIRLLDDEPQTVSLVRERIIGLGDVALPYLREAARSDEPTLRSRARILHEEIRLLELQSRFAQLAEATDLASLEQGAFLIAQYGYADVASGPYRRQLNQWAQEIADRLGADEVSAEECIEAMSGYIFGDLGFQVNVAHFYDPDNSYIHRVIDRRLGIPITLALVYLFVGRRLSLPVSGVALPHHFLVRFDGPEEPLWIDPAQDGMILSEEECLDDLEAMGFDRDPSRLAPTPVPLILARQLANLFQIYRSTNQTSRAAQVQTFIRSLVDSGDEDMSGS